MLNTALARNHIDTVDRAGLNAQVAARALIDDHGMHLFGRAQNRIDRTGLNTLCATNALVFPDVGNRGLSFDSVFCVEGLGLDIEQIGQRLNRVFTAGRAFVNGISVGDRFGIRPATGITTLSTLCLRENTVDLI